MPKVIKEGKITYWVDGSGAKVPTNRLTTQEKDREKLVNGLIRRAKRLQEYIAKEKEEMNEEIKNFLGDVAALEDEEWVGGAVIRSFAGDQAVRVKLHQLLTFDERLTVAKQKIDKCIGSWSNNANSKLVSLVNDVFRVNQSGQVNAKMVLGLRKHNIDDPLWLEAMELISDSVRVQSTKTYFYFQEADEDGELQTIVLEFSRL